MIDTKRTGMKRLLRAPALTPAGFVARAAVLIAVFLVCHLLGWREHTTFLSGTPAAGADVGTSAVLGMIYIATYFGAVLAAPILLLAAGLLTGIHRLVGTRGTKSNVHESSR